MELIELHDIFKTYYLGEIAVPVLKGVSLKVAKGNCSPSWAPPAPAKAP